MAWESLQLTDRSDQACGVGQRPATRAIDLTGLGEPHLGSPLRTIGLGAVGTLIVASLHAGKGVTHLIWRR